MFNLRTVVALFLATHLTQAATQQEPLSFSPRRSKLSLDDIIPSLDPSSGETRCCPFGTSFDGKTCTLGTASCHSDATLQDGKCVSRTPPRCETGQKVNDDGLCVTESAPYCPSPLQLKGRNCVDLRGATCDGDLKREGNICISKIPPQCNGTDYFHDGSCVSAQGPTCGEGKEYIDGFCISQTPPSCGPKMVFDPKIGLCVHPTSNGCPVPNTHPKNGVCVSDNGPKCGEHEKFVPDIGQCVSRHPPTCGDPSLRVDGKRCTSTEGPQCQDGYELSFTPSTGSSQCCPEGSSWDGVSCVSQAGDEGDCLPGWEPSGSKCKLNPLPAVCEPMTDLVDGKCVSQTQPQCTDGYERNKNNQCVSRRVPQCPPDTQLIKGECVSTVALKCPQDSHFEGDKCVSNTHPQCSLPNAKYDGKGHCVVDDMPRCPSGVHNGNTCLTGETPSCPAPFIYSNGQCISSNRPNCPHPLTLTPEGDCISHKQPVCDKGIFVRGQCFVGEPSCPPGTDYRHKRCVDRNYPECTEEGYEWYEPEGKCRKTDKTDCGPDYHEQDGECVSDIPGDCGDLELRDGQCVHPEPPKCPPESGTYWDGEDCRSPDEPDCGPGKVYKKDKGTCVAESKPVCESPDMVFDPALNKCVTYEGPQCPQGQRFNPATEKCVLAIADCLEFEFCPTVGDSSTTAEGFARFRGHA
ncbi:hypothetical protein PENFLA_c001G00195 [Penicillium flavigenum]|uniref:Chitin-binding type-2 domain-containing protein n=1 Tax=Penicillium flavigenum TaxID=254877 RepID=A0A1V6U3T8_9EURO|nr:hypothetical protein PENFLA_c001G00195 [Penicillium flavigenum]